MEPITKDFLKNIPRLPGIYIFKDKMQEILYVGKAKSLKSRVSSYFRRQYEDHKVQELIKEHADLSYIVTNNETEALLLEAQLIRDFKPKFNVLLKSGQPFLYLFFTESELKVVRNKKEKGVYFGPFLHKKDARAVADYLIRTFKLRLCHLKIENGCLDYHIGRCPGSCMPGFNIYDHQVRLYLAQQALKSDPELFLSLIDEHITAYNKTWEFEKSARLAEYRKNLDIIFATIKTRYHEKKYAPEIIAATQPTQQHEHEVHEGLVALQQLLALSTLPQTIDCFDISHFQSNYIVGSCIRFTNGKPDKNKFRRFKIRSLNQQNDYAALQEIVQRRYKDGDFPAIILIDGGKGQLNAIRTIFENTPCISLAKREERVFTEHHPDGIVLDIQTHLGKLLITLRDYAHHFAISYHQLLRKKGIRTHDHARTIDTCQPTAD